MSSKNHRDINTLNSRFDYKYDAARSPDDHDYAGRRLDLHYDDIGELSHADLSP